MNIVRSLNVFKTRQSESIEIIDRDSVFIHNSHSDAIILFSIAFDPKPRPIRHRRRGSEYQCCAGLFKPDDQFFQIFLIFVYGNLLMSALTSAKATNMEGCKKRDSDLIPISSS